MKNKKSLIGVSLVLGLISMGAIYGYSSTSLLQANLLATAPVEESIKKNIDFADPLFVSEALPETIPDLLTVGVSTELPKSSDLLDSFNMYKEIKSERALIEAFLDQIQGDGSEIHAEYITEILSYVYRVGTSPYVSNKLPMWPEYNIATVGNILAYLFPQEPNPMIFAQILELVAEDAKSNSYLSKAEFIEMVAPLFIGEGQNPYQLLATSGFISSQEEWQDESKEGFLLVEAIRIILNMREVVERENIKKSRLEYDKQLVDLGNEAVTISEQSLELMMNAFVNELVNDEGVPLITPVAKKKMEQAFSVRYGLPLTAQFVTEAREMFFKAMNKPLPLVYELPPVITAGRCNNEMFRKTYMGSVAVTGPLGTSIICEKVMIQFPANSYLLNIYSLPKITSLQDPENSDRMVIRTDSMRSYKNSLVLSPSGEERLRITFKLPNLADLIGKYFEVATYDRDNGEIRSSVINHTDKGGIVRPHLRSLSGNMDIIVKYLVSE